MPETVSTASRLWPPADGLRLLWGIRGTVTASQVAARLARRTRYRWLYPHFGNCLYRSGTAEDHRAALAEARACADEADPPAASIAVPETAASLRSRRVGFLNLPALELNGPSAWVSAPDDDRLWLYNLHYGEWAVTLASAFRTSDDPSYRDALIELVGDWIDRNPLGSEPGWEPYPIARRLVAWSRVAVLLRADPVWQRFWSNKLASSLRSQARVLAHNLERDLANNHLIADYRALAWIGLTFAGWPEARRFQELGLGGLLAELHRQVLPDGAHDERSVSYHAIVLQDALETWCLAAMANDRRAPRIAAFLGPMTRFLAAMRAPDGSWPMVNDTVPGYPDDPDVLLAAAARLSHGDLFAPQTASGRPGGSNETAGAFPAAGYVVIAGADGDWALFDAGPMGPDRMPGHGHADALSVELRRGHAALVVDPGVYTYQAGPWRDHFRATAAHNTAVIDGQDQCVFWGAFRVAYPVRARLIEWSATHAVGEHRGYGRLSDPVMHRRRVELVGSGTWLLEDRFEGRGSHEVALVLQLARGAHLDVQGTGGRAVWADGTWLEIAAPLAPDGAVARRGDGWISPGWNLKHPAPKYVLEWRHPLPTASRLILRAGTGGS